MPERLEQDAPAETPPLDPTAVQRAYRFHRAKRRVRNERTRRGKRAGVRFWVVLLVLIAGIVALGAGLSQQIEQLFGL